MLLHFGTQSETADFSEHGGGGFPAMPKLNQRMEKVNVHKEAKENKGAHSEHKGGDHKEQSPSRDRGQKK